jgi:leucine-zipper of insertion element IS481
MLMELSVVEQRYLAVREVLDGAKITDVAIRYGVDRRTVHRWLLRYANDGLGALADRSSRPDRCLHQIAPEVEARIVALRTAHPGGVSARSFPSFGGNWTNLPPGHRSTAAWCVTA